LAHGDCSLLEVTMHAKRQVLFVQGGGKGVHDDWDSKLVESLRKELGRGYEIHYPRMPNEADPKYASWKNALKKDLEELPEGAILVAHSVGGTILLKVLTEHRPARTLGGLFVIAAPFGHDHHGVGLVLSDVFWTLFLISVPVFIVLCLIASVSAVVGRRQASP